MNGKIRNFTLDGQIMRLNAYLDNNEKPSYKIDFGVFKTEMHYDDLVRALSELKEDIENILDVSPAYKEDKNGNLIYDKNNNLIPTGKNEIRNPYIRDFEKMYEDNEE